jgi:hypothetical protein
MEPAGEGVAAAIVRDEAAVRHTAQARAIFHMTRCRSQAIHQQDEGMHIRIGLRLRSGGG